MKTSKRFICIVAVLLMVCTLVAALVGCNKGHLDPETRQFVMAIQLPDGVFNPFFSTSAYDSNIIGLTQVGMLTTDTKGAVIAGLNEPTVALDYSVKEYDENDDPFVSAGASSEPAYTKYRFLIKNGMKFSDGSDLTIQDVLFNLYVYLDPVYTGSATIYSTDIQGLSEYRTQESNLGEEGTSGFDQQFIATATTKRTEIIDWVGCFGNGLNANQKNWRSDWRQYENKVGQADFNEHFAAYLDTFANAASLFYDELVSDWNAINLEDYKDYTGFDARWKIFLVNDTSLNLYKRENGDSGKYVKNEKGNYILDDAKVQNAYNDLAALLPVGTEATEETLKRACLKMAFETYFGTSDESMYVDVTSSDDQFKTNLVGQVSVASTSAPMFEQVVRFWATADTLMDEWAAKAKSDYFKGGTITFPNITGITVERVKSFSGEMSEYKTVNYDDYHYVLNIKVNKVDPKAIYNFSFTVAPRKYYSTSTLNKDFDDDFNNWVAAGAKRDEFNTKVTHFGVKYADSTFMQDTVNNSTRTRVPIGAGPYKATNASDNGNVTPSGSNGFYNNNMVNYVRNDYFYTLGTDKAGAEQKDSKLQNAVIKYVKYKVVEANNIINSLGTGEIDFGEPNAIPDNITQVNKNKNLGSKTTLTLGYGYIGINPRFVEDIHVRKAIMMAMNRQLIQDNYYGKDLCVIIQRPMSIALSQYYPTSATEYYHFDSTGDEIKKEMALSNYVLESDGLYHNKDTGDTLDYKFTIAGGNVDHPAYATFLRAQELLNGLGFDVKTVTSATALTDLSAGKLEVWAAAWGSSIDPDMYQVYHMDSQASSTNNWGYKWIKADRETYSEEYDIITALSENIDAARQTTVVSERARIYSECLNQVMSLAVELPTYNRYDLSVFNKKVVDESSLPMKDAGPFYGLLSRIWTVRYV